MIEEIQNADGNYDGILLNAGGYSHTSVAIRDAISAVETPVLEIHISNVFQREEFRHGSMIAAVCKGSISGFGFDSTDLELKLLLASRNNLCVGLLASQVVLPHYTFLQYRFQLEVAAAALASPSEKVEIEIGMRFYHGPSMSWLAS